MRDTTTTGLVPAQCARLLALLVLLAAGASARAQSRPADPAYVVRGRQTEVRQLALKDRLDRLHSALAIELRRDAPDLLAKLEPPPPIAYGYQILPRIVPDARPAPPPKPHVVTFSWAWSDTLISREMASLDRLDSDLAKLSRQPQQPAGRHAACEVLVASYQKALAQRRLIDADIDYNWLWQRQIADDRPLFDGLTARLNAAAANPSQISKGSAAPPALGLNPPTFLRLDALKGHLRILTVPLYTDISDASFVESFRRAIETYWHVRAGEDEYRVRLAITTISPERLYCAPAVQNENAAKASPTAAAAACAPPARGAHIHLDSHVAHFPAGAAVLTTGAESLQVTAGRSVVLGSHDVAPRVLAHEFGHVLGFPDAYLRGYKDLGTDGFAILELVPNYADIMSSPGAGSVLPRHFTALIAAKQIAALMQAGLDALYQRADASAAVASFRQVLSMNPDHYGATLQLAKALDQAGKSEEALPLWRRMLTMATAAGDVETLAAVRKRLANARP